MDDKDIEILRLRRYVSKLQKKNRINSIVISKICDPVLFPKIKSGLVLMSEISEISDISDMSDWTNLAGADYNYKNNNNNNNIIIPPSSEIENEMLEVRILESDIDNNIIDPTVNTINVIEYLIDIDNYDNSLMCRKDYYYEKLSWGTLHNANNIDINKNQRIIDLKFAFKDIKCTRLIEYYDGEVYYIANDHKLYSKKDGILKQGIDNNYLLTWLQETE